MGFKLTRINSRIGTIAVIYVVW